ncbi:uncharacterized protein LOC120669391 [Panicum virgatum]|uniref:uncharacterized protein LOC120669391 n=1 Tax=Panicum virgatum TaxID=38727 RepID=UPI0019D695E4|nr:uncharacterized protein LOC120669391 [Panicum virgatum]
MDLDQQPDQKLHRQRYVRAAAPSLLHFFLGLLDRRRAVPEPELELEPPKMAQRMQPDTRGDGGSTSGATSLVRNTCWLLRDSSLCPCCFCFCFFSFAFLSSPSPSPSPAPPRRSMPMLRECRSSGWGSSAAPSAAAFASASASVRKRSSQTRPEDPDLLKVVADLCNPAMGNYPPPFSARGTSLSASERWRTKGKDELEGVLLLSCPPLQVPTVLYM